MITATNFSILPTNWHRRPKDCQGDCPICGCWKKVGEHRAIAPEEKRSGRWIARKSVRFAAERWTHWEYETILDSPPQRSPRPTRGKQTLITPPPQTAKRIEKAVRLIIQGKSIRETAKVLGVTDRAVRYWQHRWANAWKTLIDQAADELGASPTDRQRWQNHGRDTASRKHNAPSAAIAERLGKAAALISHGKPAEETAKMLGIAPSNLRASQVRWADLWKTLVDQAAESMMVSVRAMAGTAKVLEAPDEFFNAASFVDDWAKAKGIELFPPPNGETTLSRFFEEWYLPQRLFDAKPSTILVYRVTVKVWRLLTGDPPIGAITAETVARFRDARLKMRGLKPHLRLATNTVRSNLQTIQTLLDKLGPPGRGNRDGLGILARVPWVLRPRREEKIPRTVPLDHLRDCLLAAIAMDWPRIPGVKPPAWWRALLIIAWNTGLRRGSLFTMRWSDVEWEKHRLVLPAARMKSRRPMIVHLNEHAMKALRSIRTERTFIFPMTPDESPCSYRRYHEQIHKLEDAAGIKFKEHFGLKITRNTVATTLWETSPGAAQFALGHTSSDVTRKHYVDGGALVARALDAIPQPAFSSTPS
jgi:integrase